jgi:ABC-2 type transport system permease protein
LLLCSSYARSKPFIWAVALPLIVLFLAWFVGLLRTMSLSVGWFWTQIIGRLLASIVPFGWMSKANLTTEEIRIGVGDNDEGPRFLSQVLSFDGIGQALTMPGMWIGAAAGAAMIAAAIYFRRSRIESHV